MNTLVAFTQLFIRPTMQATYGIDFQCMTPVTTYSNSGRITLFANVQVGTGFKVEDAGTFDITLVTLDPC